MEHIVKGVSIEDRVKSGHIAQVALNELHDSAGDPFHAPQAFGAGVDEVVGHGDTVAGSQRIIIDPAPRCQLFSG